MVLPVFPVLLALVLLATPGSSEDLFDQGRKELKLGQLEAALRSFEQSYALQPTLGTLLNLADCHDRLKHAPQAWRLFTDAKDWAWRDEEPERFAAATARLAALEPQLARLTVRCEAPASAIHVSVGTRTVACDEELVLAPGPGTVEARGPSRIPVRVTLELTAGARHVVVLPRLELEPTPTPAAAPRATVAPTAPDPGVPTLGARRGLLIGGGALSLVSVAALAASITVWNRYAQNLVNPTEANAVDAGLARAMVQGVYPAAWVGLGLGLAAVITSAVWSLLPAPEPVHVAFTWASGPGVSARLDW